MDDVQATLLLTRPARTSAEFLSMCERRAGRRLDVITSPLIEIVDVGDLPDFTPYRTVIVSSGNAVRRLSDADTLRGRNVATVGKATASAARESGADAVALGQDVSEFLTRTAELKAPCIHCRGTYSRGDVATTLSAQGIETHEAIIYDQIAVPLNAAANRVLSGAAPVVVPLFSPRSAVLLGRYRITAPVKVIAMSDAVAEAWPSGGDIAVAKEPTVDAMCDATLSAI